MDKILLNWLPPASIDWPSASLSVLKSFLQQNNYFVEIKYWNFIFHDLMKKYETKESRDILELIPFFSTIANECSDKNVIDKIKVVLQYHKPSCKMLGSNYFEEFIQSLHKNVLNIIDSEIESIHRKNYLLIGFSARYSQWIPSKIISDILKRKCPQIKIVIGGFGNKEEARTILENNISYDFAIWGEGEIALLELSNKLQNRNDDFNTIAGLVYRSQSNIIVSEQNQKKYVDLCTLKYPNYDDYFEQLKSFNFKLDVSLPIEGSRGCHWRKCKFCFLNEGYRYRIKDATKVISEIKILYEKHNVSNFMFLDNDLIGTNITNYEKLVDELTNFKRNICQNFEIQLAEIIPYKLRSEVIKKMARAGFMAVQLGWEATCDSLLINMNKKSRFASNILFAKWAIHYGIKINGANIITGIINESDEDIIESINNLHYLRFFLSHKGYFDHELNPLAISMSSLYYKMIPEEELPNWNVNVLEYLLPKEFYNPHKRFITFSFSKNTKNELWKFFEEINKHYKEQKYNYRLLENGNIINYEEYYNGELINSFSLIEPVYWEVLKLSNYEVTSLNSLVAGLSDKGFSLTQYEVIEVINNLKNGYMLYSNLDYTEIVGVINVDSVI